MMNRIANFYTWFWVIYFPVCIAFTVAVNYDYSDEILTILLLLYAIVKQKYIVKNSRRKTEIVACMAIFFFYLVYSFLIRVTTTRGIFLDIMQQIRPYLVFYLTWILSPEFNGKQKQRIKRVMLATFFAYLYFFFMNPSVVSPYGGGFSEGESAALGQIALCCAMIYYLFTEQTKKNALIAVLIMLLGLVSGKSKFFGECVVFISLIFFVKKKIKFTSFSFMIKFALLTVVVLFFTWTKFNIYYVEGMKNDDTQEMARPLTYKTGMQIMWDYFPFGSGFGTFGCAAASKEYSPLYYKYNLNHVWGLEPENPMFLADTFYPIYPAQFGLVGVILFLIFWRRRIREINKLTNIAYYRIALMCILALALESTADSSYLSGKGMGYFMILALCLNSYRYKSINSKDISTTK